MSSETTGSPPGPVIDAFHKNADTDGSPKAIHHTLGPGINQAASGNHTHNGSDSPELEGYVLVENLKDELKKHVQRGAVNITGNGNVDRSVTVNFPTPFDSVPTVVASGAESPSIIVVRARDISETSFLLTVRHVSGTAWNSTYNFQWIATDI